MKRRILGTILAGTFAAVALVLVLGGCSSDPATGPTDAAEVSQSQFMIDHGAAIASGKGGSKGSSVSMTTKSIDGAVGGVVEQGRFKLTFPAGAFEGVEQIVIVESPGRVIECQLYPEGLTFSQPVKLEVDLSATTGSGDSNATIYWWDPGANTWVDIRGHYDALDNDAEAYLEHFSTYRPGRAGW